MKTQRVSVPSNLPLTTTQPAVASTTKPTPANTARADGFQAPQVAAVALAAPLAVPPPVLGSLALGDSAPVPAATHLDLKSTTAVELKTNTTATSILHVDSDADVSKLTLDLKLKHQGTTGLTATLTSPSGQVFPLTLPLRKDLATTLDLTSLTRGQAAKGDWKLSITDTRKNDVGQLKSWALHLDTVPKSAPSTWASKPTPFNASTMFQLPDGRIMAKDDSSNKWWALSPDTKGSFANGTWAELASSQKDRLYYASAVLNDGRVLVVGGEYISGTNTEDNTAEIYDPVKNEWSNYPAPPWPEIGDAACVVLPDGKVMLGSLADNKTAILDPTTNTWSAGPPKLSTSAEESWVLMPDGSVVTVNCDPQRVQKAELFVPSATGGSWVDAGRPPVDLVEADSEEIGPGVLTDDGRALFVGATGHTAYYTPSTTPGKVGTWAAGPDLPKGADGKLAIAKDAPGTLLPNGHVILTGSTGGFEGPTTFFDLDPATNLVKTIDAPPNNPGAPYTGRMMLLPTGELAYTQGSPQISYLTSPGANAAGTKPAITDAPASAKAGQTFELAGTGFNGKSQAVGYGDDSAAAINYPLVRLTNQVDGTVIYARTHDNSTMGVDTKATTVTTKVTLPSNVPAGTYSLEVVAVGVPSDPVSLTISP